MIVLYLYFFFCSNTLHELLTSKHPHGKHRKVNGRNGHHHHHPHHHQHHPGTSSKDRNEVTGPEEYDEEYYIEGRHRQRRTRPHTRQLRRGRNIVN